MYRDDLAAIHHEAFGDIARHAGPAIVRLLRQRGIDRGLVVDLGCGSGILAHYLLRRGYDVLGVDQSAAMVRIARRVAPAATIVRGRAAEISLPCCSAVVATGESLTYLSGRQRPMSVLRKHIRRVSHALRSGGLFVFDLVVADSRSPMAYRVWQMSHEWAVLTEVMENPARRTITRRIVTFRRHGQLYRRSDEVHRVGVYDRRDVVDALRASGFRVLTMKGYGRFVVPPRRLVFVARRS